LGEELGQAVGRLSLGRVHHIVPSLGGADLHGQRDGAAMGHVAHGGPVDEDVIGEGFEGALGVPVRVDPLTYLGLIDTGRGHDGTAATDPEREGFEEVGH
jgi:hypothetical protein